MAMIYVANCGDDSNPGTKELPVRTAAGGVALAKRRLEAAKQEEDRRRARLLDPEWLE